VQVTAQPSSPGPGRSTADAAFDEAKRDIARRNEQAQKAARKARAAREQKQLALRRERDRQ
jgi:hypothetical protein